MASNKPINAVNNVLVTYFPIYELSYWPIGCYECQPSISMLMSGYYARTHCRPLNFISMKHFNWFLSNNSHCRRFYRFSVAIFSIGSLKLSQLGRSANQVGRRRKRGERERMKMMELIRARLYWTVRHPLQQFLQYLSTLTTQPARFDL